jgi:phage I-like protein
VIRLRSDVALSVPESAVSWAHIARTGRFDGYHGGGFELGDDVFEAVVSNFARQSNPIAFVYEHPVATGSPIPAAGWIRDLAVRDDGLWAEVEWTERAATMLRSGEYRYCSMVIDLDDVDRESGEPVGAVLLEVGLTNTPFIDGLAPITLKRHGMSAIRSLRSALEVPTRGARGEDQARRVTLGLLVADGSLSGTHAAAISAGARQALSRMTAKQRVAALSRVVKLVDVDAVQDALDELPDDAEPEAIMAVVDAAIHMEEALDEDAPASDVEAADKPDEEEEPAEAKRLAAGDPEYDALSAVGEMMSPAATAEEVATMVAARAEEVAALLAGESVTVGDEESETLSTLKNERDELAKQLSQERFDRAMVEAKARGIDATAEELARELFAVAPEAAVKRLSTLTGTAKPPVGRVGVSRVGKVPESIDALPAEKRKEATRVALAQLTPQQRQVFQSTRVISSRKGIDYALSVARGEN